MFESIAQCMHFIKNKYGAFSHKGGKFVDLGHGTGKGILTACLMHEFEKCTGVELLSNLYSQSVALKQEYEEYTQDQKSAP